MRFGRWGRRLGAEVSDFVFWEIKLRIYFGAASCHLETIIFVHGQVMFPYLIFVILRFVTWKIFFGQLVQKKWNSLFFRFLCSRKHQQSDGSCNDSSDTQFFCKLFKKATSLLPQRHIDHTSYVTTTSLLTTKTSCEFYSMAVIAKNYLETLMSCYTNWTLSIPHTTTWMSLFTIRVPIKPENFCREGTCNW